MLYSFRFLGTAKRSQMEGGQACRPARDGRISVQPERCHHRDYLPGGHQYGKYHKVLIWQSKIKLISCVYVYLVFCKSISHFAALVKSQWGWIWSRRGWTNIGIILAAFAACLWAYSAFLRVARFSAKYCKTLYWSSICITTLGSIRFRGSAWTWFP